MRKIYHAPMMETLEVRPCKVLAASMGVSDKPASGSYEDGGEANEESVGMDVLWDEIFRN